MGIKFNRIVSTAGGIGYLPGAPGTIAAAFSVIIWYVIFANSQQILWQVLLLTISVIAGIYCSGKLSTEKDKDPSYIVIDEVAGMWLSLLFIPPTLFNYIAAFILFRFFDIVKPLGIHKMEAGKKGWGIMMDDLLAGFYSNIALRLLIVMKLW